MLNALTYFGSSSASIMDLQVRGLPAKIFLKKGEMVHSACLEEMMVCSSEPTIRSISSFWGSLVMVSMCDERTWRGNYLSSKFLRNVGRDI